LAVTRDGGQSWTSAVLPGEDTAELDLRDVESPAPGIIVAMAAGPGEASRLFLSKDDGRSWLETARNQQPDGFWDGIAFWDATNGLLVGDPLDGRLTLWRTIDGGRQWQTLAMAERPQVAEGEYCFAASGTSLALMPGGFAWLVTGGSQARVFRSTDGGHHWLASPLPLVQGSEGAGAFSIAFRDALHGVVVGGDYLAPTAAEDVAAWTEDGGRTWHVILEADGPRGYRSAVAWLAARQVWWCTGPSGSEWSADGQHWQESSADGMHAIDAGWMSGGQGRTLRSAELP